MVHNLEKYPRLKDAFWELSTPIVLLSIFQAGYSLIDMFWASQLSQQAFFAIGVTSPLISLISSLGDSIGIGTNSIMSRGMGKWDFDEASNSLWHGIISCAVLGIIFILAIFFLKDILSLMDVTNSTDLAIAYLAPMFLFSFVIMFSSLFANTLQAEGNSKIPTIVLILTNILNLILDPILIFVLDWGIVGAAYASIISSAVAVIFFLYWYLSGRSWVVLSFKYFKPGILYEIFIVAVPNFIIDFIWCFAMMFVNKVLIDQLGNIGVLLYSTALKIETLILSPQKGFGKALVSIGGGLFGSDNFKMLKELYGYSFKISFSVSIICAVAFFILRDYGFALFSVTDVQTSVFYIALAGIVILPCEGVMSISNKLLDGMGKSYYSLILISGTIILEMFVIGLSASILTSGVCVLFGILVGEVVFAAVYYILLNKLFKREFDGKQDLQ